MQIYSSNPNDHKRFWRSVALLVIRHHRHNYFDIIVFGLKVEG